MIVKWREDCDHPVYIVEGAKSVLKELNKIF